MDLIKNYITHGVSFDSRQVLPGSCFFALKGAKFDAHDFLEDVAGRGALAAVVHRDYNGPDFGLKLFFVEDVLETLQRLAQEKMRASQGTVIGITGSVGKTTTKEFLATILERVGKVFKSPGNYNSKVTLPVSILNQKDDVDYYILEMGMDVIGEIKRLVEIAPIDYGIITKLCYTHYPQEYKDIELVAQGKCELLSSPRLKRAFIHAANRQYKAVKDVDATFYLMCDLKEIAPFKAKHLLENLAGAICVARALNVPEEKIIEGVTMCTPFAHRFDVQKVREAIYIDDAYNACFDSMVAAFKNMPKGKRRVAVFAGTTDEEDSKKIAHEAVSFFDKFYCYRKESLPIYHILKEKGCDVERHDDFASLGAAIKSGEKEGDVALVKGSWFNRLWELFPHIK